MNFTSPVSDQCANGSDAALWAPQIFLFTAQFISGIGQPLYSTLGISYMDDNIQKSKTPAFVSKYKEAFHMIKIKRLTSIQVPSKLNWRIHKHTRTTNCTYFLLIKITSLFSGYEVQVVVVV